MAAPISFKPLPVDPQQELMRRVESAPREHAEALLVAWDLLQTAHDKGMLDLAQGLIEGRDVIAKNLAVAAKSDAAVQALRNIIALSRVLSSLDPDMLQRLAKSFEDKPPQQEKKAPGIFTLLRRAFAEDTRRGLGFALSLMGKVGAATKD
jgi:uncharacterized protein YjgD (DUF1641 family)